MSLAQNLPIILSYFVIGSVAVIVLLLMVLFYRKPLKKDS